MSTTSPHAPLGGIEHAGWKLKYDGDESEFFATAEDDTNLNYSLGLRVKEDGSIVDISMDGPAGKAAITPSTHIVAVNGRQLSLIHI